jgi:hypothetical protein
MTYSVITGRAEHYAKAGAWRLLNLIQHSGKFIYEYNVQNGKREKQYNLLRHCGSLWSVVTTTHDQKMFSPEGWLATVAPLVIKSLDYITNKHTQFRQDDNALFVVWHGQIKLGANALYLLTLIELIDKMFLYGKTAEELVPFVQQASMVCNGIYAMFDNGKFIHKTDTDYKLMDFESDYYTGEALFALARWRNVSKKYNFVIENIKFEAVGQYLMELAAAKYGLEFQSHWMVYAITEFLYMGAHDPVVLRNYLDELIADILNNTNYRKRDESTPIACRTEALVRALAYYTEQPLVTISMENILIHAEATVMIQLGCCKSDGAIIRGGKKSDANHVRIDYIQHNISGFSGYVNRVRAMEIEDVGISGSA